MKTTLIALALLLMISGCETNSPSSSSSAGLPFSPTLEPLIGQWASNGELALIVEREEDSLVLRNPPNEVWSFLVTDLSTNGTEVTFTQKSFLTDGSEHPFNNVPCYCTISPVEGDGDSLRYSLTSDGVPDLPPDILTRLQ